MRFESGSSSFSRVGCGSGQSLPRFETHVLNFDKNIKQNHFHGFRQKCKFKSF